MIWFILICVVAFVVLSVRDGDVNVDWENRPKFRNDDEDSR